MKTYIFNMMEYSDEPGLEFYLYTSLDVSGSWCSERGCFIAALQDFGIDYSFEEWELLDAYSLEDVCLRNNIYVCFEE